MQFFQPVRLYIFLEKQPSTGDTTYYMNRLENPVIIIRPIKIYSLLPDCTHDKGWLYFARVSHEYIHKYCTKKNKAPQQAKIHLLRGQFRFFICF